jgi:hypothetical protein
VNDELSEICVRLLNENVDVWVIVQARHLSEDLYLIVEQPYDRDDQAWEFVPGEIVSCKWMMLSDGRALVATGIPGGRQSEPPWVV